MSTLVTTHQQRGWAWHIDADGEAQRAWCEAHRYLRSEESDPLWQTVAANPARRSPPSGFVRWTRLARRWFATQSDCDDLQLGLTLDSGQRRTKPYTGWTRCWHNRTRWRVAVSLRATPTGYTSLDLGFAQNSVPLPALLQWFGDMQQRDGYDAMSLAQFRTLFPSAAIQMTPWQWASQLAGSLDHLRFLDHDRARWHEPSGKFPNEASFSFADGLAEVRLLPNPVFAPLGHEPWRFIAYDGHDHTVYVAGRRLGRRCGLAIRLTQPLHRYFQQFAFGRHYCLLAIRGVVYRVPEVFWPGPETTTNPAT